MTEPNKPEKPNQNPWESFVDLVEIVFEHATKIILGLASSPLTPLTILIIAAGTVIQTFSLPPEERHNYMLSEWAKSFTDSGAFWWSVVGWSLFAVSVAIHAVHAIVLRRRLDKQGAELANSRADGSPKRLSSKDPLLLEKHKELVAEKLGRKGRKK